jgi:hypothetical protein
MFAEKPELDWDGKKVEASALIRMFFAKPYDAACANIIFSQHLSIPAPVIKNHA